MRSLSPKQSDGSRPMNDHDTFVPVKGLKKAMARKMIASWTDVPQFQLQSEFRCEKMIAFRKEMPFKLSYTAIFVRAIALTLKKHPELNASWSENGIVLHGDINIGVAVDSGRGLLVPVIRNADQKSLEEIQTELNAIKAKAPRGNFRLEEMQDATFTLSNLGMYRITSFTSILNTPEAGILAIGKMLKVPAVSEDGTLEAAQIMRPSYTVDHRVTDGAAGAKFLTDLVDLLEHPEQML